MSSEISITTLILIVEIAISVIVLLYSAYISFVVRRGLVVPLYRSRALWLGILAILWGVFFIFATTEPRVGTVYGVAGLVYFLGVAVPTLLVLFVWIDRTLSTLIRLDYLRKDIIGWKKAARPLYWLGVAVVAVFSIFNSNVQYLRYSGFLNYLITTISAANVIDFPIVVILLAYATTALIVGSIRTRDLTFRNHAKWFGYAIVGLLAILLLPNPPVLYTLPGIFFAYCFYRMARSLVPVNKL